MHIKNKKVSKSMDLGKNDLHINLNPLLPIYLFDKCFTNCRMRHPDVGSSPHDPILPP